MARNSLSAKRRRISNDANPVVIVTLALGQEKFTRHADFWLDDISKSSDSLDSLMALNHT